MKTRNNLSVRPGYEAPECFEEALCLEETVCQMSGKIDPLEEEEGSWGDE